MPTHPAAQCLTLEDNPLPAENCFLPVERNMIQIFADRDTGMNISSCEAFIVGFFRKIRTNNIVFTVPASIFMSVKALYVEGLPRSQLFADFNPGGLHLLATTFTVQIVWVQMNVFPLKTIRKGVTTGMRPGLFLLLLVVRFV